VARGGQHAVRGHARARARVLEVDNSDIQTFGVINAGSQTLKVEVLAGEYEGQVLEASNTLVGKMETDCWTWL